MELLFAEMGKMKKIRLKSEVRQVQEVDFALVKCFDAC